MAGMGAFQRRREFTPEGPAQFLTNMQKLLGQQSKSLEGVSGAVDSYGQGRATNKVAELMGSDGFDKLTPEQAQAAAMKATGGRAMNESGENMLSALMTNKQKTLDNTNKIAAAEKLFSNQQALQTQKDNAQNKRTETMYGTDDDVGTGSMSDKLFAIQQRAIGLNNSLKDKGLSKAEREAAKGQLLRDSIEMETLLKKSKVNAGAAGNLAQQTMPNQAGKPLGKVNAQAVHPNANGRLNTFLNSKLSRELGVTKLKDKHGNYTYWDKNGQAVDANYLDELNKNKP